MRVTFSCEASRNVSSLLSTAMVTWYLYYFFAYICYAFKFNFDLFLCLYSFLLLRSGLFHYFSLFFDVVHLFFLLLLVLFSHHLTATTTTTTSYRSFMQSYGLSARSHFLCLLFVVSPSSFQHIFQTFFFRRVLCYVCLSFGVLISGLLF